MMNLFYILEVAFGIGLVIFVHELGHFLVAVKVGVRVEVFSLGFGPRLFGFRRGPTDYRVSAFPFGGYVKMAGENSGMVGTGAPDEFTSKTVGQRALIAVAGVTMNIITGMIIFCLAFAFGVKFVLPEVGTVVPGLAAQEVGLQEGDRILSVNGKPVNHYHQLDLAMAYSDVGEEIEIIVERQVGEEIRTFTIAFQPEKHDLLGFPRLDGLSPKLASLVASTDSDLPAAKAVLSSDGTTPFPIERGDLITSVGGVPVDSIDGVAILREIYNRPGEETPIRFRRGVEIVTVLDRDGDHVRPRLEFRGGEELEVLITPKEIFCHSIGAYPRDYPVVQAEPAVGSAAYGVIHKGDEILEIQGEDARRLSLFRAVRFHGGRPIDITVMRGGENLDLSLTPRFFGGGVEYQAGVRYKSAPVVGEVDPGSPAAAAGLLPGDIVLQVGDRKFESDEAKRRKDPKLVEPRWFFVDTDMSVDRKPDEPGTRPVTLKVRRGGEKLTLKVKPAPVEDLAFGRSGIGLRPPFFSLRSANLMEASKLGIQGTVDWIRNVFLTIRNLANRRVDPKNLGGPVMIAQTSYHFATQGFGTILYFLGIISVNLAILNILPVPVLDGGLLLFLLIEKVKGSPVKEKYMILANYVGLALLLSLMLYVTYNDISRLIPR